MTGASSYRVVAKIVQSNLLIEYIKLVIYEQNVNWRNLAQAFENHNLPLLLKGLEQDQGSRILTKLSRSEVSEESLRKMAERLSDNRVLGLCSNAQLVDGQSAHIPMMDFMCAPSEENLRIVTRLIGDLRQGRGFVLRSGRSYHYYGLRLMTQNEWEVFLGKCLLMSGFADDRYIGHQLVDGHCVLRLSCGKTNQCIPIVEAETC